MSRTTDGRKVRPLLGQALCGLALCFTLLIFAPAEMVTLNSTNFWFGVMDFLPVFAGLFAAAFLAVEAAYLLLRRLPYVLWLLAQALLFGVTLCVYVQGTYLCMGSEALISGEPVWREMLGAMIGNLAVWAAILLGCMALSLTKPKLFCRVVCAGSALILVMEAAALATLAAQRSDSGDLGRYYCSDEDQFTYSDNGDVVVVMLDTFDMRLMEQALAEDPEETAAFADFTYYRNTSCSAMLTDASLLSFLTGEVYHNEEPYFLYCRRAMRENAFFSVMKDAGMTLNVYGTPKGIFGGEQLGVVDNLRERDSQISDPLAFAKEMLCMIGYRYMPTAMQPFLLRDYQKGFGALQQMKDMEHEEASDGNLAFMDSLQKKGVTMDDDRRFFKFYLLHGAHKPVAHNRDLQEDGQASQYEALLGCMRILSALFEQMKTAGAYDGATIIVLGDHGINDQSWTRYIGSPAMLVKYPGEKEPMRISDAPVELLDMRATALYGAGLDHAQAGTPAHAWEGVKDRDRRMVSYVYDVPSSYKFYMNEMTEYIVPADAADLDGYTPSGRTFSAPQ